MILVMGSSKESRHDLRRKVGMMSRGQEALEDFKIAAFTSATVAGEKSEREGGACGGSMWGEFV